MMMVRLLVLSLAAVLLLASGSLADDHKGMKGKKGMKGELDQA